MCAFSSHSHKLRPYKYNYIIIIISRSIIIIHYDYAMNNIRYEQHKAHHVPINTRRTKATHFVSCHHYFTNARKMLWFCEMIGRRDINFNYFIMVVPEFMLRGLSFFKFHYS